jgi:hypothetical protein
MVLLVVGAIVAICGYILLFGLAATYIVIGGYMPGGGRFILVGLIATAIGHGIFAWGRRKHPFLLSSFISYPEEEEKGTESDENVRAEVDR